MMFNIECITPGYCLDISDSCIDQSSNPDVIGVLSDRLCIYLSAIGSTFTAGTNENQNNSFIFSIPLL